MLNLPDWLPWWVPLALLVPALLWALSFLFMPFSVFGVKSRLEVIEGRLEEIQNDLRHMSGRFPAGVGPAHDYDEVVFPPRLQEPRIDRISPRPPIPPARHELHGAPGQERPMERPVERMPVDRLTEPEEPAGEPALEDRPPPSPNARPARRNDPISRPARAEPRLDWRR
jgi:hypothetical protein